MRNNDVDTETIDILLIGNEDELAEAIYEIDRLFKGKIVELIRRKVLSANTEDLLDIYQEALLGIYLYAKEGKYEPEPKSLKGLIYRIASNKADDWVRKRHAKKRSAEVEEGVLIDAVVETIRDSNIAEAWENAQMNEGRKIILKTIQDIIPRLKLRQRQVAEIICQHFPASLSNEAIRDEILRMGGELVTVQAVKRAREEVLKKVEISLR